LVGSFPGTKKPAARNALALLDDRSSELRRRVSNSKIALARWIGDGADAELAGRPPIDSIRLDPRTIDEVALSVRRLAARLVSATGLGPTADRRKELLAALSGAADRVEELRHAGSALDPVELVATFASPIAKYQAVAATASGWSRSPATSPRSRITT